MSFLPSGLMQQMLRTAGTFAPREMTEILRSQLESIANGEHTGLLTFGFVMALWSSSAALVALTDALNRAYDIEEARPWWKVRLIAIALTLALAAFVLVAFGLILAGPTLAEWVSARVGLGSAFEWTWKIVQWPLVFGLVAVALACVNYFAPDADQDWAWVSPGALLATFLWLLASLGFKVYVANFGSYNETYGSLGGIIVLMLWFYITGLAILAGAEMNAEIEHASPYGKNPGEKVPGQRKKLGARAARAFAGAGDQTAAPNPALAPSPTPSALPASKTQGYFPGALLFLSAWLLRRRRTRD